MSIDDFKENVITDDVAFKYNDKEYFIFLFGTGFTVGEYGTYKDIKFDKHKDIYKNREDMFSNWVIGDKPLKDIIPQIEVI